jgi:predicted RNA-binding Zn-ribbon protein involved in translation (DUF1610 family)
MTVRKFMVPGKVAEIAYCKPCAVNCLTVDPAYNKWRDTDKEIPCSTCGTPIRWFARYVDGYFKSVCPKCGTQMEKDGDVTFKKSGAIVIPDEMESDTDEPVRVTVPVNKLKGLGRDQKNALKAKLRRRADNEKTS